MFFIVNLEHIPHLFLVLSLLTLTNKCLLGGVGSLKKIYGHPMCFGLNVMFLTVFKIYLPTRIINLFFVLTKMEKN